MSSFRSLLLLALLAVLSLSLIAPSTACGNTCQANYFYLQRPLFNYTSNGCGAYGVSVDAPFGANMCCMNHDYCYSNCSTVKDNCDNTFDTCLSSQCDSIDSVAERAACRTQAELFYRAVMGLGCPAYSSAQDKACECNSNRTGGNGTVYYFNDASSQQLVSGRTHAVVVFAMMIVAAIVLL